MAHHMSRTEPMPLQLPQELSDGTVIGDGVCDGFDAGEEIVAPLVGEDLSAAVGVL